MRKRILAAFAAASLLMVGTAYAGDAEKKNDVVFRDRHADGRGPDYIEVFKKEGTNGKNYLYTVTQIRTEGGLFCTVITFSSETAGTATCLTSIPNPEAFRPLDPARYADGRQG